MTTVFRLLIDRGVARPRWAHGADHDVLTVPRGTSSLSVPVADGASLQLGTAPNSRDALVFEALDDRTLLVCATPETVLRFNGHPAPPIAPLVVGDRLDLVHGASVHVTVEARARAVAPDPELVGTVCPMCRVPIAADSRVHVCPRCRTALHLEGDDKPSATRLECARLCSSCPTCAHPLSLQGGLIDVPTL
jgi:hypothetical protein